VTAATDPALIRIWPTPEMRAQPLSADIVFRNADDLVYSANPTRNLPPEATLFAIESGSTVVKPNSKLASGATILKRYGEGDYSWLATIVPDGAVGDNDLDNAPDELWLDFDNDGTADALTPPFNALSNRVTVSVAVFHKRLLNTAGAGESTASVTFFGGLAAGLGGGEIQLNFSPDSQTKFKKGLKPGQWLMLAGKRLKGNFNNSSGTPNPQAELRYFRWYKVVAADAPDPPFPDLPNTQNLTLAGPDWDPAITTSGVPNTPATAWLFDGVIAVYEKNMRLEVE
jgi:hypothetical protein